MNLVLNKCRRHLISNAGIIFSNTGSHKTGKILIQLYVSN